MHQEAPTLIHKDSPSSLVADPPKDVAAALEEVDKPGRGTIVGATDSATTWVEHQPQMWAVRTRQLVTKTAQLSRTKWEAYLPDGLGLREIEQLA
jgi:hypothetical protein